MTEQQILSKLDDYKLGDYCQFIDLGHVYSYLIDTRLNIFRSDNDKWAIAAERLGYNPRADGILGCGRPRLGPNSGAYCTLRVEFRAGRRSGGDVCRWR